MDRLYTTREAAEILRLSPKTLHQARTTGRGPTFVRVGGAVRYLKADLEAFVEAGRRVSTADDGPPPNAPKPAHRTGFCGRFHVSVRQRKRAARVFDHSTRP